MFFVATASNLETSVSKVTLLSWDWGERDGERTEQKNKEIKKSNVFPSKVRCPVEGQMSVVF